MKTLVIRFPLAAILLLALAGCESEQGLNKGAELTGEVTIAGKKVTAGNVAIYSEDGRFSAIGSINEYGKYTVKEPPLGKCQIEVVTSTFKGMSRAPQRDAKGAMQNSSRGMELPPPEEVGFTYVPTPERYEKRATSGLTVEIKKGNQQHNIELTN